MALDPQFRAFAEQIAARVISKIYESSPPVAPEWLDVRAAAAYLSLTEKALRMRLYKENPPPSHRVGNLLRFSRIELDAWVRGEC